MIEDYEELFNELYLAAVEGRVHWQTTASENQFVVVFKEFSLAIKFHPQDNEPSYCSFVIRNSSGQVIDQFWVDETNTADWHKAYELYSSARRKALGIDVAVKNIVDELRSGKAVGKRKPHPLGDDEEVPF
jgi:hypothetical protein